MAVYLTMPQVRAALLDNGAEPRASTQLLARLFIEVMDELLGQDRGQHWTAILGDEDLDRERWQQRLIEHAYRQCVAPRLLRQRADLDPVAKEVCLFWEAVQNLCTWSVDALWERYRARGRVPEAGLFKKIGLVKDVELHEPGWTDSVRVTDIRESLWLTPGAESYCAIELCLDADGEGLEQACLYRLLTQASYPTPRARKGMLRLISFSPARQETAIDNARLEVLQRHVKRLIGRAAGVLPTALPVGVDHQGAAHDYVNLGKMLVEILRNYGIEASVAGMPTVEQGKVQFLIELPPGIRVTQPDALADDIKQRLRLKTSPLLEHVAGHLFVGLEVRARPIFFFWPTGWTSRAE
ncbi:MAG: hypothetical protein L0Z53_10760 [Acidobacteriales bacterium]|nr:hypothetical protein [Terriglobales bacterium]